jgi:NADH:ubiquinone oxidoreductase subunit 4 (subunit M)
LKNEKENVDQYADLNRAEFYIFVVLTVPILVLGVYSGIVTDLTSLPIEKILSIYNG